MRRKSPTPSPIAVPQKPADYATRLMSLYYTKLSAADLARELRTAQERACGKQTTPPDIHPQPSHDTEANDNHPE
jgi:hypothetical protein